MVCVCVCGGGVWPPPTDCFGQLYGLQEGGQTPLWTILVNHRSAGWSDPSWGPFWSTIQSAQGGGVRPPSHGLFWLTIQSVGGGQPPPPADHFGQPYGLWGSDPPPMGHFGWPYSLQGGLTSPPRRLYGPPKCTHTHIQTDGDYTKHVVKTLQDHMLKKPKMLKMAWKWPWLIFTMLLPPPPIQHVHIQTCTYRLMVITLVCGNTLQDHTLKNFCGWAGYLGEYPSILQPDNHTGVNQYQCGW